MYETLALLALFVLVYSSVAGAIERTWISGPIVFTCFGLLVGPMGFDLLTWETDRQTAGTAAVDRPATDYPAWIRGRRAAHW